MRKVSLGMVAAGLMAAAGSTMSGSSHREAPGIAQDPQSRRNGLLHVPQLRAGPNRANYVTFLANYIGLEDAYGGPNFFMLDENAVYEIHVDNNGNGVEDITFQFQFQKTQKNLAVPVGDRMTPVPLINIGGVGPGRDDTGNLNVLESYTLSVVRGGRRTGQRPSVTDAAGGRHDLQEAGRSDRGQVAARQQPGHLRPVRQQSHLQHHHPGLRRRRAGCSSGSAAKGFVVNLGEVFDLINLNPLGPENGEENTLADKNVTTLALEVPISCLVAGDPIIGAWTTASIGEGHPGVGRRRRTGRAVPCGHAGFAASRARLRADAGLQRLGAAQSSAGAHRRSATDRPAARGSATARPASRCRRSRRRLRADPGLPRAGCRRIIRRRAPAPAAAAARHGRHVHAGVPAGPSAGQRARHRPARQGQVQRQRAERRRAVPAVRDASVAADPDPGAVRRDAAGRAAQRSGVGVPDRHRRAEPAAERLARRRSCG